jgi:hypothetical protein
MKATRVYQWQRQRLADKEQRLVALIQIAFTVNDRSDLALLQTLDRIGFNRIVIVCHDPALDEVIDQFCQLKHQTTIDWPKDELTRDLQTRQCDYHVLPNKKPLE